MDAKRQFVKNLAAGDDIDDLFSVKYKKPPRRYARGFAFEARVADRTGEVTMKYWGRQTRRRSAPSTTPSGLGRS